MAPLALAPIPRNSLTRESIDRLREAILRGELAEGAPLPEAATAAKLGVSRVPVREALVVLDREGLVAFDAHGRASVRSLTREDIEEIVSLRTTLQSMAARLAAKNAGPENLQRLTALVDRTARARDLNLLSALDMEFHDEIVAVAKHKRLARAWSDLRPQIELLLTRLHRRRELKRRDVRKATVKAHRAFISALKEGPPHRVGRMMEDHCNSWVRSLPSSL